MECKGLTKKGTACSNLTKHISGMCGKHQIKCRLKSPKVEPNPSIELDMGDLTQFFPSEIIQEILLNLNLFDLCRFSQVNRSCSFFIKQFELIQEKEKNEFCRFVKSFRSKPCIVGYDVLKKYNIPHPAQHLILFPKEMIRQSYFYTRIRSRIKHKKSLGITINESHYEDFSRKFLNVPSTMLDVLSGKNTIWNFQTLFLYFRKIKRVNENVSCYSWTQK
jgi:hypothetical protein